MSKASSPIKVLHTAYKRVGKGWVQKLWHDRRGRKSYVCLEGAIYGYCDVNKHGATQAQKTAISVVQDIIAERHDGDRSIPAFNDDPDTTKEEVMEVIKLAIIRLETGGEITDDEFEELLEFKDNQQS